MSCSIYGSVLIESSVVMVLLYVTLTAVATGLGALPLLFTGTVPDRWVGLDDAVAGGLMIAASFNLMNEGVSYGASRVVVGVLIGLVGVVLEPVWVLV